MARARESWRLPVSRSSAFGPTAPGWRPFEACPLTVRNRESRWPTNTIQHKVPRHPPAGRCGVSEFWLDAGIGGMRPSFCR